MMTGDSVRRLGHLVEHARELRERYQADSHRTAAGAPVVPGALMQRGGPVRREGREGRWLPNPAHPTIRLVA